MQMIADLHTHTLCATHAYNTFTEMAAAAKEIGYCALAVTDHAPAMPDSPHAWHFQNWSAMPREIGGVVMLWTFRKASSKRRIGSSHPSIAPACRVC